jgi:hypothetical protein
MLLWTSMALGDIISVSWTPPTTRVDGSALLASEIKHYRLSWTVKGVAQPDKIVTGSSYSLDTGLLTGRVCVWMRTVDVDLLESDPTPQECKNVKPNPPSGVKAL